MLIRAIFTSAAVRKDRLPEHVRASYWRKTVLSFPVLHGTTEMKHDIFFIFTSCGRYASLSTYPSLRHSVGCLVVPSDFI